MPYRGHIENGVVILDELADIAEGTVVSVEVFEPRAVQRKEDVPVSDYDRLESMIGKAEGLAPDFAENHDHYIHGQPKQ